jgi:deoxyribodipyrimidine photo-lyase
MPSKHSSPAAKPSASAPAEPTPSRASAASLPRFDRALVWFRRDLRVEDHTALSHSLAQARQVWCVFVFDSEILDALPSRRNRRVEFIWHCLVALDHDLRARGGGLLVRRGRPVDVLPALVTELGVQAVFANRDYEPTTVMRDERVADALRTLGVTFQLSKDQVIFERDEVLTATGTPYSVFTPYKNAWLKKLEPGHIAALPVEPSPIVAGAATGAITRNEGTASRSATAEPPWQASGAFAPCVPPLELPSLEALGFEPTGLMDLPIRPGAAGAEALIQDFLPRMAQYADARDFPAKKGPSYLSVHLRFGTVSIRRLVREARARSGRGADTWLSELIWREFYFQILHHHPRVVTRCFKPEYDRLEFNNDPALFAAWCEGRTGYPLVDAAQRQLNATGYMHNRLRMVTASFLVKDMLIDWRWGERYFAEQLIDHDLAANNGGWQWAASTGCDAQPYFRIFNPVSQSEKFDAEGRFIRRYVPELARVPQAFVHAPWRMSEAEQRAAGCRIGVDYPAPVVDHNSARKITLARYSKCRGVTASATKATPKQ